MTVEIVKEGGNGGGGSAILGFLLGGVMVVVAVVGFFMWDNYKSGGNPAPAAVHVTVKKS